MKYYFKQNDKLNPNSRINQFLIPSIHYKNIRYKKTFPLYKLFPNYRKWEIFPFTISFFANSIWNKLHQYRTYFKKAFTYKLWRYRKHQAHINPIFLLQKPQQYIPNIHIKYHHSSNHLLNMTKTFRIIPKIQLQRSTLKLIKLFQPGSNLVIYFG